MSVSELIAIITVLLAAIGGALALFNAWKAILWKRAELASSYMKELNSNAELVFACRALDWNGGRLVVPEQLRPLLLDDNTKTIVHERPVFQKAMRVSLSVAEAEHDPRMQIYRTALDALLSWLDIVDSALSRNLFLVQDLREVKYWVDRIADNPDLTGFINNFGYRPMLDRLEKRFSKIS